MFGHRINQIIVGLVFLVLGGCALLEAPPDTSAPTERRAESGPFRQPVLRVSAVDAVSLDAAYARQGRAVRQALGARAPAGFKAGLTSSAAQQRFGLREPIAGVLWPDSARVVEREEPVVVRLRDFRKPMLEVELAFRVNTLIPEPLASVAEAQNVISEVMPALELPDLGFDSEVGLSGEAVVAANAGARYFVLGEAMPVEQIDVNAVRATLSHNGHRRQRAEATQVMGNQWRALYWLINTMVEQGWVIQPGQVLLTGAMAEMLPLEEGLYQARFSELGDIYLQVE